MKRNKKVLLIVLSSIGGSFVSAAFAAAFICTTPAQAVEEDYDIFANAAYADSGDHVSTYKTDFNNKKTTSEYEIKYNADIQEAGEKLAYYAEQQSNKDVVNIYTLKKDSDNLAALYIEDLIDNIGKEIDNFFNQIKMDREKVNTQYKITFNTLKKAFDDNVSQLEDTILDCERYMAELDKDDENYQFKIENYENQIEITRVELEQVNAQYDYDLSMLNASYDADLTALDVAEEQVIELKENYEAQLQSEEEVAEPAPLEEIIEEFEEPVVEAAPVKPVSIAREAKSVSLEEKEDKAEVKNEAMVETINEINPEMFTFKYFDHCYLYLEPKDKDSYWHF